MGLSHRLALLAPALTLYAGVAGAQAPVPTVLVATPELADDAVAAAADREWLRVVVATPAAQRESADETIQRAWQQYVAMDFEPSLETIRAVVVQLETGARTAGEFDALAEALVIRGMGELALGREDAARESFGAAARLRPDRELEEGRYPPPVREAYGREAGAVRAEPASSITVTTTPPGARLYLDGAESGVSPNTIHGTSGRHQLRVEAPGYATRQLTVTLRSDAEPFEVALPRADEEESARQLLPFDGDPGESARAAFARTLRARRAVRVRPVDGGVDVLVLDLDGGGAERSSAASIADAIAAIPAASTGGGGGGAGPGGGEPPLDGVHRNDGLYFRLGLGLNFRGDAFEDNPAMCTDPDPDTCEQGSASTAALDFEVALGGHLGNGWIIGGAILALLGGSSMTLEAPLTGERELGAVGGLAFFATWYPGGEGGWNVYAALGGARGTVTDPDDDTFEKSLVGASLALGGGYEFWFADDWGAGVFARLIGFTMASGSSTASAGGLTLAATLTYN